MPSLGGAHTPVPLSRRRGSSFLNHGHGGAGRDRPPTGSATSSSSNIHHSSSSTTTTSSSNSNSNNSSASHTPQPPAPTSASEPPITSLLTASSLALSSPSATLCFHARNVPAISIEAYLLRILKYCPTTNEVFLSLLVYFDRMARVGLEAQRVGLTGSGASGSPTMSSGNGTTTTTSNRLFAIDSFNVHRLVIAGVTVASKFFSDVFYTNSRYAKVGGLPLHELNQLELQFLLLNDFRLMIPVDELQRY
ncbi:cyclin-related 2, partial [Meredithblackwellia eburnea MCA 4105]